MIKRLGAIIRKEFRHILRDWQTLIIVLAMPIVMMFLYGYALDVTIENVPVIIEDPSPSVESRELIKAIDESELFKVVGDRSRGGPALRALPAVSYKGPVSFPRRLFREPAHAPQARDYPGAY